MPEPLETFWKIAKKNNVDDDVLSMPVVEDALEKLENFGKETLENFDEFGKNLLKKTSDKTKKPPLVPGGATPTYQESAFIEPKNTSTLYDVTRADVPGVTKESKFFDNVSYKIKDFTVEAGYKPGNSNIEYRLFAGEKFGTGISIDGTSSKTGITAEYNVNNKTRLSYKYSDPVNSCKITLFKQDSNYGVTVKYSNWNGLNTSFSADKNSDSASLGYGCTTKEGYKVNLGAYATTGKKNSDSGWFAGVQGRIFF